MAVLAELFKVGGAAIMYIACCVLTRGQGVMRSCYWLVVYYIHQAFEQVKKFLLCIVSEVHFVQVLISVQQHYGHEGSCEHGKYIPCVHVNVSSGL